MPTFRIVYIDDDTFAPRSLTADFPDRAAAEIAMAKHGHRVVHVAALEAGARVTDPILIAMPAAAARIDPRPAGPCREQAPAVPKGPILPRYDLAGAAVAVVGLAVAGVALFLF